MARKAAIPNLVASWLTSIC